MSYTKEEINERIERDYQNSLKILGEIRTIGVFHTGNDLETITLFFPTIQDMAINCPPINSWLNEDESGRNRWIDFRLVADMLCNRPDQIGIIFIAENFKLSPIYQKLFLRIREEIAALKVKEWVEGNAMNLIAEKWEQLFDHYLQFRSGVQMQIFDSLTKTEEKALIYILETIGEEGVMSISQAIQGSGISRPVFTSLLDKLNYYKAAEIRNMGVKGTYINFYDHILSKFEIS
jgi:hypothetical protein